MKTDTFIPRIQPIEMKHCINRRRPLPKIKLISCFYCPKKLLNFRCWHLHDIYAHRDIALRIQKEKQDESVQYSMKSTEKKIDSFSTFSDHSAVLPIPITFQNFGETVSEFQVKEEKIYNLFQNGFEENVWDKANNYECIFCEERLQIISSENHYERIRSVKSLYRCSFCPKLFRMEREKNYHELSHTGVKPYECESCSKLYDKNIEINMVSRPNEDKELSRERTHIHSMKSTEKKMDSFSKFSDHSAVLPISITFQNFGETVSEFHANEEKLHILQNGLEENVCDEANNYECIFCVERLQIISSENHYERILAVKALHRCSFCPKLFSMKCEKNDHEKMHTGEKPYECESCSQLYGNYIEKKIVSNEDKKLFCERTCIGGVLEGNDFSSNLYGATNEEVIYKCKICSKTFEKAWYLYCHERDHTAKKRFKCIFCHEEFTLISEKIIHESKHVDKKPYKCKFCRCTFIHSTSRDHHQKYHLIKKPLKCKYCPKRYTNKHWRKVHENSHICKSYGCHYCPEMFFKRYIRRVHEKKFHPNENQQNIIST